MMRVLVLLLVLGALPATAAELTITIDNTRSAAGNIRAGIFNSEATWLESEKAFRRAVAKAAQPTTTFRFEDLPPGRYAVALYHDENANAKHDRNFVGMPVEGFGFTRNPTVALSAPDYAECVIDVPETGAAATIRLKY